jgi:RNA polymerase sigma factor (TIGR02999 family)
VPRTAASRAIGGCCAKVARLSEITELLGELAQGRAQAGERLYALLYPELKKLARGHLARSGPVTLEPATLIHEFWLRGHAGQDAASRAQLFAHASAVIRSVIIDHLRARNAEKRGGGIGDVTLSTAEFDNLPAPPPALRIDDALHALQRLDARCHDVVQMRYFGGLTLEEIAGVMSLSVPTVKRDWRRARAFLFDFLAS